MNKTLSLIILFYLAINSLSHSVGNENFFEQGLKLFNDKKYEDARFLFERSIVFDPKNSNSYLYLAKIYNIEEDQNNEEKNLETALLIEPENEESILLSRT